MASKFGDDFLKQFESLDASLENKPSPRRKSGAVAGIGPRAGRNSSTSPEKVQSKMSTFDVSTYESKGESRDSSGQDSTASLEKIAPSSEGDAEEVENSISPENDGEITTESSSTQLEDSEQPSKLEYDETLPKGGTVRRRAYSKLEADMIPDDEKSQITASDYKQLGNDCFKGNRYEEAISHYTEALKYLPRGNEHDEQRAILYANRAACSMNMLQFEPSLYDLDRSLELNPTYLKAIVRHSNTLEKLEKYDEALSDAKKWVEMEASNHSKSSTLAQAKEAVERLEKLIKERDEKMKEEMMGKLKDLGNMVLGKFGLSLDNFKAVQDPATGSYSISFQQ
jgi:tetratricopeptide (TPR) repeat protein